MLGWRPDLVWDIGFQLSFAGTASIILLTPAIEARLPWLPGPVREPLAVTYAAQVGTAPLMAASFHVISPSAPLANAAVLPLLPALVAGGLMLAPLAALPDLGRLVALPVIGLLRYLEQVAAILAHAPSSAVTVPDVSPATGVAYYLGVGGAMVAARTRGTARRAAVAVAVLGPLIVGAGELVAWDRPQPAVTVLSVGQGQAVLVSGPAGYVLIDGGPNPAHLKNSLGVRLPPWRRRLAALVVTAPLQGHVGGLAELDYPAGVVVLPEGPPGGTAMRTVALEQAARGARPVSAHAGQVLSLAGLRWEVLSPAPAAPDPGQLAFRIVGPDGRAFCDLSDLGLDDQVAAAAWLAGRCDTLLLPGGGRSAPAPELTRAARPGRLIASDPGGRLARDLPAASVSRTSEEGDIVLPL
jgi:competence protein ComEC